MSRTAVCCRHRPARDSQAARGIVERSWNTRMPIPPALTPGCQDKPIVFRLAIHLRRLNRLLTDRVAPDRANVRIRPRHIPSRQGLARGNHSGLGSIAVGASKNKVRTAQRAWHGHRCHDDSQAL